MLFPKADRVAQPSLGIGPRAESEAVSRGSVSAIFDLYSGVSQILNSPVHYRYIRDAIICADRHKGRGESSEKLD